MMPQGALSLLLTNATDMADHSTIRPRAISLSPYAYAAWRQHMRPMDGFDGLARQFSAKPDHIHGYRIACRENQGTHVALVF